MLSALNSKLRRRNSHGSPLSAPPGAAAHPALKIGPQRTTKTAQKLKLLPNPDPGDDGADEESGRDVYAQFTRIKDPTSRRDAARLGKADRETLPRVTAYCTANSYRMAGLMKFLKGRAATRGASPKQLDECIYSPFQYPRRKSSVMSDGEGDEPTSAPPQSIDAAIDDAEATPRAPKRRKSDSALEVEGNTQSRREELLDLTTAAGDTALEPGDDPIPDSAGLDLRPADDAPPVKPHPRHPEIDTEVHTSEVFLFDYGTVVIWGMTRAQEQRFLKDLAKFETEKLAADDVQSEDFNFYYTREYQARIYNDFISLRDKRNYMTKLAISHALSQSVKVRHMPLLPLQQLVGKASANPVTQTSLFEDLLSTTIAATTPLPAALAADGALTLSRRDIHRKIGELFILRINIHLQGSVLDSPELLWAEPRLQPVYAAVRDYLEMDERARLLTQRLDVLADLLAVLKDQARTSHGEALEWIVIVLIAAEILVAAVNIVVDLVAGVD